MLSLQVVVGLLSLVGTAFGLLSDEEVQRITKIIKSENQCFMVREKLCLDVEHMRTTRVRSMC